MRTNENYEKVFMNWCELNFIFSQQNRLRSKFRNLLFLGFPRPGTDNGFDTKDPRMAHLSQPSNFSCHLQQFVFLHVIKYPPILVGTTQVMGKELGAPTETCRDIPVRAVSRF